MTAKQMIAVLQKTARIARLRKLDIATASGYAYSSVDRWYRHKDPRLNQFIDWAETMGYEVTLRRKSK